MDEETTTSEAAPETEAATEFGANLRNREVNWKAEARKWEARAKANRATAQKLEEQVRQYERERQRESDVSEVAKETGVPASVLGVCTSREQMEQLAAEYVKESAPHIPSGLPAPETRIVRPVPDMRTNGEKFRDWAETGTWAH